MSFFLKVAAVFFVGFAVLACELTIAGFKHRDLKMRQTRNGVAVNSVSKSEDLHLQMQIAKKWAESLDEQSGRILQASSMGRIERWRKNIDLTSLKAQYAEGTLEHLKSMVVLLKAHRASGGFKHLREFDFRNMLRKHDYLLALPTTKESLKLEGSRAEKILVAYHQERQKLPATY